MEGGGLSGEAASDERCPVVDTYLAGQRLVVSNICDVQSHPESHSLVW